MTSRGIDALIPTQGSIHDRPALALVQILGSQRKTRSNANEGLSCGKCGQSASTSGTAGVESERETMLPTGELSQIQEALQTGRQRIDDYRAIFVNRSEGYDYMWWTERPMILYRKGTRFRAGLCRWMGWHINDGCNSPPKMKISVPGGAARLDFFHFYPQYVVNSSTVFTSKCESNTEADGTQRMRIAAVTKTAYNTPAEDIFPLGWSMRPEFVCRPPLGIDPRDEVTIHLNPSDGPTGCILLCIRRTTTTGRMKDRHSVGLPDEWHYWLDPEHDYIAMRQDMILRDEPGQEDIVANHTVEEVRRSPRGVWFATKIRRVNSGRTSKGEPFDQVYHLYVDFDLDLLDSLFAAQKPGRIH